VVADAVVESQVLAGDGQIDSGIGVGQGVGPEDVREELLGCTGGVDVAGVVSRCELGACGSAGC
jgi:hypothetical protein